VIKVAVVSPGKGESHTQVIKGFKSITEHCFPRECVLHEFMLPHNAGDSVFRIQVGRVVQQIKVGNFDLVYTVGVSCSTGIKQELDRLELKIPLIFVGATNPEQIGLLNPSKDGVVMATGVSMRSTENTIPLEVVFRLYGLARRVVLVYRLDANEGRSRSVVRSLVDTLNARRVEHTLLEYVDDISSALEKNDVVIIPQGSLYPTDLSFVEKACIKAGAEFVSGSSVILPHTALFGYKADLRHMGDYAARMAAQIIVEKVSPGDIKHKLLEDVSQLVLNNNAMISSGVAPTNDEFVFDLDSGKEFRYTLQLFYHYFLSSGHVLGIRIFENLLGRQRDAGKGLLCEPIKIVGSTNDMVFTEEQAAHIVADAAPFVTVFGNDAACLIQNQMIKQGRYKPMLIMKFADDDHLPEPALRHKGRNWPKKAPVMRIVLPKLPVTKIIDIIAALHPTKKRIGFVHSFGQYNGTTLHAKRYREVREYCEEKGLEFVAGGSDQGGEAFATACRDVAQKVDALFCLPDEITPGDAKTLAQVGHAENVFTIGGDYERFGWMSGVLGIDYESVFDEVFRDMAIAARGLVCPQAWEQKPKESDCYYFHLNRKWLLSHNYPIPKHLESLLQLAVIIDTPDKDGDDLDGESTMLDMLSPLKTIVRTMPTEGEVGEESSEGLFAILKKRVLAKLA
jgi:ABC-type uncharacterized transport system substrate-binding protein